ncbi:hypothetical protein OIO90_004915 [Microbotryomycetes sp. JL221]|nr:hypothetical protein OIO90_004915 [Microbotryomycetes sp. JL221]
MSTSDVVQLRYLTLHPLPKRLLPLKPDRAHLTQHDDTSDQNKQEAPSQLVSEAHQILTSPNWTNAKVWHDGLVTTWSLDHTKVKSHSIATTLVVNKAKQPSRRAGGWFGGGGASDTSDESDEGIAWHKRTSRLNPSDAPFDVMYSLLGLDHTRQEQHYVSNMKVQELQQQPDDVFLKQYSLPFPTTNRSFLCHVTIHIVSDDEFLVISLPVDDEGDNEIKRASSLANSVQPFLQYLAKHTGIEARHVNQQGDATPESRQSRQSLIHRASSEMSDLTKTISRSLRLSSADGAKA